MKMELDPTRRCSYTVDRSTESVLMAVKLNILVNMFIASFYMK